MGWGNKAIEIRSVESGHLDGVFMHKKVRIAGREGTLGFSFSLVQQTWGLNIKIFVVWFIKLSVQSYNHLSSAKGITLYIIIWDIHQFIGH